MKDLQKLSAVQELRTIESLQKEIDFYRPLTPDQEDRILQKLRLDWNYHSTAIEGNSLNYGETIAFLMHGVTAKGKPLKDHLDIKGHNLAIDFLMEIIKSKRPFSENDLRELHTLILVEPYESKAITSSGLPTRKIIKLGQYKTSPNSVRTKTGEMHYYASPEETPALVSQLITRHNENIAESEIHPLVSASYLHHEFVKIHPFDDGNGRVARLIMNLTLMASGYPPVVIRQEERLEYYSCLTQADAGDLKPFVAFIAENLINSLELYLKGARGEELSEPNDLAKEVALFKMELEGQNDHIEVVRSVETQLDVLKRSIVPFLNELDRNLDSLRSLFITNSVVEVIEEDSNSWAYLNNDSLSDILLNFEAVKFLEDTSFHTEKIAFQFNDFKSGNNSFGIELVLNLSFSKVGFELLYEILPVNNFSEKNVYITSQNLKSIIKLPYHKVIEKEFIKKSCVNIGKDFLTYIKAVFKNPDFLTFKPSEEELESVLSELKASNNDFQNLLEFSELHFISDTTSDYFLLKITNALGHVAYQQICEFLQRRLNIRKHFRLEIEDASVPF